jgi:hypothetical protein
LSLACVTSACIYKRQLHIEDINDTFSVSKLTENASYINDISLSKSKDKASGEKSIEMSLDFSIKGLIRDVFVQENWERAYNKHDNYLRLSINLDIKNNGKVVDTIKLIRKGVFFWTRNPKINHRIWIMIVKDEEPFYPLEEEEARRQLFEFHKDLEIALESLSKGKNNISILVRLSWGKHDFIEKSQISKESNTVLIDL